MNGMLSKGNFEGLLQVLENPIYNFNLIYETSTCTKLDPETIGAIVGSGISSSSKAMLLSADCVLEGNVLQKLALYYARTWPENVLISDTFQIGKVSPAFLDELLNRAFGERLTAKPVKFCNLFRNFSTEHYEAPLFKAFAWRTISVSCFLDANFVVKTWIIAQCGAGIALLDSSKPTSVWIESMERLLTLMMLYRQLLTIRYDRSNEHFALVSNNIDFVFKHLDELRTPEDPRAAVVLRIMLNLCICKNINVRNFARNVLTLLKPELLTADWLIGVLSITIGSVEEILQLAELIAEYYNPHPEVCLELERFLRRGLNSSRDICAVSRRKYEQPETIKDLRSEFLPKGYISKLAIIPAITNTMTMPYERLYATWVDLKRINYSQPETFSEYYFGFIKLGVTRVFSDHRSFLRQVLSDFLGTPELYVQSSNSDGIIANTLYPPSRWEIIGTIIHQQFLLRDAPTLVIDKSYFIAALNDNLSALLTIFLDIAPNIAKHYYGLAAKYSIFSELYGTMHFQETVFSHLDTAMPVRNIPLSEEDGDRNGLLFGKAAKLFAKSLRQAFKIKVHPAEQLYYLIVESRKIKSKNG